MVQRGALGKNNASVFALARVSVAGGAHRPRDGCRGHRRNRAPVGGIRRFLREGSLHPRAEGQKNREGKVCGRRGHVLHRGHDARRQGAAERHQPLFRRWLFPCVRRTVCRAR